MQLPSQSLSDIDLRKRWNRTVFWIACALASNLVCGLVLAVAMTRSPSTKSSSEIVRNVEAPAALTKAGGGSCRVLSGTKIRSL